MRFIKPAIIILSLLFVAILACRVVSSTAPDGLVRFDFETGDLQGWAIVEGDFPKLLTDRDVFHHVPTPYNKQGKFFLSTLETPQDAPDDGFTGVVESPVFVLDKPSMSFLVGGGSPPDAYVALCTLDGAEVMTVGGQNGQEMRRVNWEADQLVGKKVFLRMVDRSIGSWGHITFDDFTAHGHIDQASKPEREALQRKRMLAVIDGRIASLRNAITDLMSVYGPGYPNGRSYIARLEALHEGFRRGDPSAGKAFDVLAREALVANPLVSGRPILFVVRSQYRPDHHNTATFFPSAKHEYNDGAFTPGGALKTLDLKTGQVRTLVDLPEGVARDPEVSFPGRKVIFSMRKSPTDSYHIYEIGSDGRGLRQLTSLEDADDIDPLYLADDDIAFSSTREPKYCMCNRHIMANLYRMSPDGSNIYQIGKSTLFEGQGSLMPDGRIMYYRWEYVDRNFGDAQGLWTANPDGTDHAVYWGNNTPSPGAVIDARVIPGSQRVICTFSSCHDRPWGALAIIDRRLGVDGRASVVRTWPSNAIDRVRDPGKANDSWDAFLSVKPKYEDPYPLSDKYFLCSRMTGNGEQMGIYLVDVFGNEILLHSEEPGCFDPMPLGPRPRPVAIPSRRDFSGRDGSFYVQDVYQGTHMKGVKRGSVKYLRVVESPEKRHWTIPAWPGQGTEAPAMNWHDFNNKRILGTVPVEADGSAYFAVPSGKFVYFQLLDAKKMMIQSMRSGTMVQPGETAGCIGCHDNRRAAPRSTRRVTSMALRRPADRLTGWYGEPRLFNYMSEVQPVFDRRCMQCHDFGGEGSKKLLLASDRGTAFNMSYTDLWRKRMVQVVGAGPAEIKQAYSWGSHVSPLVATLLGGHKNVKLSEEEMDRIITWVDINAPYYPTYATSFPDNPYGRSPITGAQMTRLEQLIGQSPADPMAISFDRPELSPCLAGFLDKSDSRYQESLSIIRSGQEAIAHAADSPDFRMCEIDRWREDKYAERRSLADRFLDAIRKGTRMYDPKPGGAKE